VNRSQRGYPLGVRIIPWLSIARALVGSRIFRHPAINADDRHSLPHKVLLQTFFNIMRSPPHRVGASVREDPNKQVHLADTHQLTKQVVRKEGFVSQSTSTLAFNWAET
jgi:hypothetical protein